MRHPIHFFVYAVLVLTIGLTLGNGCTKKDSPTDASAGASGSSGSSGSSGGASASASGAGPSSVGGITGEGNADAVNAVRDELNKHWVKVADGWISEYPSQVNRLTGERAGPESFYREVKDLKFTIEPRDLSETDKLNGYEFFGDCTFTTTPKRVYGDPMAMGPVQWSQWESILPTMTAAKVKGKWQFESMMGNLTTGTKPTAATLAKLK